MDTFEAAVEAVITGDEAGLKALLAADPDIVHARSVQPHRATLLHYVAANGVEPDRQKTPPNAVSIARLLLEAGANPNATASAYGGDCAPLGLLVSSVHPHAAGLQGALAEILLDYGAGASGERDESAVVTALLFGYGDTAGTLVGRGAPVDVRAAAGLGRGDIFNGLLPAASPLDRHQALVLAAIHGRVDILRRLLDVGEDPNRYNPDRFHSHATPLHQAALRGHLDAVRLLVERGARTDIRDKSHHGTPAGWAEHGSHADVARYLRAM